MESRPSQKHLASQQIVLPNLVISWGVTRQSAEPEAKLKMLETVTGVSLGGKLTSWKMSFG